MVLNTESIHERLREACNVKNNAKLADALGTTSGTLSTQLKHDRIPFDLCVKCKELTGVSIDWLLFGETETPKSRIDEEKLKSSLVKMLSLSIDLRWIEFVKDVSVDDLFKIMINEYFGNDPSNLTFDNKKETKFI